MSMNGVAINSGSSERAANTRSEGQDHRRARKNAARHAARELQAARLAFQPAALLGRAISDPARTRCGTANHRQIRPLTDSDLPVRLPTRRFQTHWQPRGAARQGHGMGKRQARRQNVSPRDQHDAAMGRVCWYYLRYLDPKNDTRSSTRRRRNTGCLSTSMSAARNTPCCTCSTRGSGTRCSSTAATCRHRSRSKARQPGHDPRREQREDVKAAATSSTRTRRRRIRRRRSGSTRCSWAHSKRSSRGACRRRRRLALPEPRLAIDRR